MLKFKQFNQDFDQTKARDYPDIIIFMCYLEADHAIKICILYVISYVILLYDTKKTRKSK
jgi:hypothetical protein